MRQSRANGIQEKPVQNLSSGQLGPAADTCFRDSSIIRDVDIAQEMTTYSREQIIGQVGVKQIAPQTPPLGYVLHLYG